MARRLQLHGPVGDPVIALEQAMRFRLARQGALAANVAHADTPGYRRVDLRFDRELERAGARLERTHEAHLAVGGRARELHAVERGPRGDRPDRNGVSLEQELIELSRNAGAFEQQATVLARLHALRRTVLGGGS